MKYLSYLRRKISIENYEVKKVIAEQIRTLSWTVSGIFIYFGFPQNKYFASLTVLLVWLLIQVVALIILSNAEKIKIISGDEKC